jgi:hypothetical protein
VGQSEGESARSGSLIGFATHIKTSTPRSQPAGQTVPVSQILFTRYGRVTLRMSSLAVPTLLEAMIEKYHVTKPCAPIQIADGVALVYRRGSRASVEQRGRVRKKVRLSTIRKIDLRVRPVRIDRGIELRTVGQKHRITGGIAESGLVSVKSLTPTYQRTPELDDRCATGESR